MSSEIKHISEYKSTGIILIILLILTCITVFVTWVDLKAWSVAVALIIASTKAFLVLTYFMHLKFEHVILRVFVAAVFLLFAIFIIITLIDYIFR